MSRLRKLRYLLPSRRRREEQEMQEELQSIREMADPAELGNLTLAAENARAVWSWNWIESAGQDLRSSLRTLRRHPGVTAIALLSLALGIGANTLVFSFVNTQLLRPLPFPDPDRLVAFTVSLTPGECLALRDNDVFQEFGCYTDDSAASIAGDDPGSASPERLIGHQFTAGLARALGVSPLRGRWFTDAEELGGADSVIVISYGLWQRRFGGSPDILGKTVRIDGAIATIIGVLPDEFEFRNSNVDYWIPFRTPISFVQSQAPILGAMARLKHDINIKTAQSAMDAFALRRAEQSAEKKDRGWRILLQPINTINVAGVMQSAAALLQGIVALVLLIACANVAGLLLAQAGTQQRELAVRAALGSGAWRIVRQVLIHSVLLAFAGGVLGLAVGWAGVRLMVNVALPFVSESYGEPGGGGLPRALYETGIDRTVFAFTFVISVMCGLVAGVAPAFQVSRAQPLDVLRESSRTATPGSARQRLRSIFVTIQIGLAFILLVAAGLMLSGLMRILNENIGFDTTDLLTVQVELPESKFRRPTGALLASGALGMNVDPQMRLNTERMRQNLAAIGGVTSASGIAIYAPFSGALNMPVHVEGQEGASEQRPQFLPIMPDYFKSLNVAIVQGREFDSRDTAESAAVAVINEAMVRRVWPNENPLGKHIRVDSPMLPNEPLRQIVGVVSEISQYPGQESRTQLYLPYAQLPLVHDERLSNHLRDITFVLRTPRPVHEMTEGIEAAIERVDGSQAIYRIRSMKQTAFGAAQRRRVFVLLIGLFGAIAMMLAVIGVYGIMANLVTQRTNELGIRIALGADPSHIRGLVIRHGSRLIGAGLLIGVLGSLAVTRVIQSALFGMSPTDPLTFTVAAILLGAIALLACYIPAWRASRIDAIAALRHD